MKNTSPKVSHLKFVESSKVISKPGATIIVKELTLTEYGQRALTSGSKGIKEGAKESFGPPKRQRDLAPA